MSNAADNSSNFPTMIIPRGTEIKINSSGQLSIKTPGNLVIQNSGVYSEIESTNGSIRIEDNVNVEAVSVKAAQACFIQGTLTAWRVHAKRIALEDRAKAYIMLQESESLDVSKSSRLVGNFANEKEIFLLLGKFSNQLKELPGSVDIHAPDAFPEQRAQLGSYRAPAPQPAAAPSHEPVQQALSILEREVRRPDLDPAAAEAARELIFALRENDLSRAGAIYRDVFSELGFGNPTFRQAYDLLDTHFRANPIL